MTLSNKVDDLYIKKLKYEIIMNIKKDELLEIINNYINYIDEKMNSNKEILYSFNKYKIDLVNIQNILMENEENMSNKINGNNYKLLDEEKEKNQNLNKQLKILMEELKIEKQQNKNLQNQINELSISLDEGKKNFKHIIERLNAQFESFNNMTNNINELKLKNDIFIKDNEIKELKSKLSRYPFELSEKEKIICVIFMSFDENNIYSIFCKNTDILSDLETKLYEIYPEYTEDSVFTINGRIINKGISLEENNIHNNSLIIIKSK